MVVGASPIGMLKAVEAARRGLRTALVERQPRLGGAWALEDALGLAGVETSPHIFMPDRQAYRVMKRLSPDLFEPLERQPQEVFVTRTFGPVKVPLTAVVRAALVRNYVAIVERSAAPFPLRLALLLARTAGSGCKRWRDNRCAVVYPRGGLQRWLAALEADLAASGVTVLRGFSIASAAVVSSAAAPDPALPDPAFSGDDAGPIRLDSDDGRTLSARSLAFSRMANFSALRVDEVDIPLSYLDKSSQHMTLLLKGTSARPFWSLYGDPFFELANDVTDYVGVGAPLPDSHRIVTLRLNRHRLFSRGDLGDYLRRLVEVGYVDEGATIIDHALRHRREKRMCDVTLSRIEQFSGGRLTILEAGELGIEAAIRRYFS